MSQDQQEQDRFREELEREAEEVASMDWSDPEQTGEYLFQIALAQKQRLQENRERMERMLLEKP